MGRRLGVAALLCGAMLGLPLLLLQTQTVHASHASRDAAPPRAVRIARRGWGMDLPTHLVSYRAPVMATTTTTVPPPTTTTTLPPPTTTTTVPPPTTTTTLPPPPAPPPPTTTTTAPVAVAAPPPAHSEVGEATWYSAASAGMCASPSLPFGTVLTVTNDATGASTTCTVDDREERGTRASWTCRRKGFAQIADLSEGVVEVTISW